MGRVEGRGGGEKWMTVVDEVGGGGWLQAEMEEIVQSAVRRS